MMPSQAPSAGVCSLSLVASTQEERHAATAKSTAYAIHSLQERAAATETLDDKLEARLKAAEGLLASNDTTVTKLVHSTKALGPCGEPVLILTTHLRREECAQLEVLNRNTT
jgi:hypothetical protein